MRITYDERHDLLYMSLDVSRGQVVNRRGDEDIVLDVADGRIVGIEILDASKRLRLDQLSSLEYRKIA
jgi:uncharacterized protein YuzE